MSAQNVSAAIPSKPGTGDNVQSLKTTMMSLTQSGRLRRYNVSRNVMMDAQ
jgi:hypothetical protein